MFKAVCEHRRGGQRSRHHHEAHLGQLEAVQGDIAVVLGIDLRESERFSRSQPILFQQETLARLRGLALGNPLRGNLRGGQKDH